MSIPRESNSSTSILNYASYHVAALTPDPAAKHLAESVVTVMQGLKSKFDARRVADERLQVARAHEDRADFELDARCRLCELAVLGATDKQREHALYRAVFPAGLSSLVAARGERQARMVQALVAALREQLPEVAAQHAAELERLGGVVLAAERELKEALDGRAALFNAELIARSQLIRQLHANRGGLRVLFPQQAGRVRSYFRPDRRRRGEDAADDELDELEAAE